MPAEARRRRSRLISFGDFGSVCAIFCSFGLMVSVRRTLASAALNDTVPPDAPAADICRRRRRSVERPARIADVARPLISAIEMKIPPSAIQSSRVMMCESSL